MFNIAQLVTPGKVYNVTYLNDRLYIYFENNCLILIEDRFTYSFHSSGYVAESFYTHLAIHNMITCTSCISFILFHVVPLLVWNAFKKKITS